MSIRRFTTVASFILLYAGATFLVACQRKADTKSAKSPAGTKTSTAAAKADLRNAKVTHIFSTAAVEQTTDARLGDHANPEGVVILPLDKFKPGQPLILSMTVKQSPSGLQMSAIWRDSKGQVLDQDRKSMNGGTTATFQYKGKRLQPGDYTVTGYWGGNIATEKKFRIE